MESISILKGKYQLERRLGHGGMAEVFAGRALGIGGFSRRVAIKRILPVYSSDPRFQQMFAEEARLGSARSSHTATSSPCSTSIRTRPAACSWSWSTSMGSISAAS